jgi:putative urate catabolism protein
MTAEPARYPRDLVGYGPHPPDPRWPGGARLALSFVLNWEEGGENNILHGDAASEHFLSDVIGAVPLPGVRHLSVESMFEYGSRAGVWRVLRAFENHGFPLTVFAVGMAVERYPQAVAAMAAAGHEICSHGWRWINYQDVAPEMEADHVARAVAAIEAATGVRPVGWYTGRDSPNTRALVVAEGGFLYDSDSYSDDLPYWTAFAGRGHLVIPYTLEANDMRFVANANFSNGDEWFGYLKDSFDVLYAEGATSPKMLSVGLHARVAGRPGRTAALLRFLDYVAAHDDVWVTRRADIARHWYATHPFDPVAPGPYDRGVDAR